MKLGLPKRTSIFEVTHTVEVKDTLDIETLLRRVNKIRLRIEDINTTEDQTGTRVPILKVQFRRSTT